MMPRDLRISTDVAFNTAHSVQNDAEELRSELSRLAREWDSISHGWSGAAASAYTALWDEWHDAAARLVDSVADSSECLAQAAAHYDERDDCSAAELNTQTAVEMGL